MAEHYATLKKGGKTFQIEIEPELAIKWKNGEHIEIRDILRAPEIYSDAKKGNIASGSDLTSLFGTNDVYEVAGAILKNGEIQVSQRYRKELMEAKRRQIIELIHSNAIEPNTGTPHPVTRIEAAFDEARVRIDYNKSPEQQLNEIIKQIRAILPLRFATKKLEIRIPAEFTGKVYGKLSDIGREVGEKWQNDGSLIYTIEIPAGMMMGVYDKINSLTKGKAEIKVIDYE